MSFAIYFYHFCWAVGAVDKFCQVSRFNLCGTATNDAEASAIYDTGLILICIFHLTEWIRQTAILTTALVNANFIPFYYLLSFNVPFGFFATSYAIANRYTANGIACAGPTSLLLPG